MSLKELRHLFSIILKEHNPEYRNWYLEEKEYKHHRDGSTEAKTGFIKTHTTEARK